MKIVIDNNVLLDVFQERKPFVQFSASILRLVETKQVKGYITANSVTDIYYILSRTIKDKQKLFNTIDTLLQLLEVIDVTAKDIKKAHRPEVIDFEDELICICAQRAKINFIVTRNTKDFVNSPIPALTPEDFLTLYFEKS
jgi:predicted nucleic acid-binding protein